MKKIRNFDKDNFTIKIGGNDATYTISQIGPVEVSALYLPIDIDSY